MSRPHARPWALVPVLVLALALAAVLVLVLTRDPARPPLVPVPVAATRPAP